MSGRVHREKGWNIRVVGHANDRLLDAFIFAWCVGKPRFVLHIKHYLALWASTFEIPDFGFDITREAFVAVRAVECVENALTLASGPIAKVLDALVPVSMLRFLWAFPRVLPPALFPTVEAVVPIVLSEVVSLAIEVIELCVVNAVRRTANRVTEMGVRMGGKKVWMWKREDDVGGRFGRILGGDQEAVDGGSRRDGFDAWLHCSLLCVDAGSRRGSRLLGGRQVVDSSEFEERQA